MATGSAETGQGWWHWTRGGLYRVCITEVFLQPKDGSMDAFSHRCSGCLAIGCSGSDCAAVDVALGSDFCLPWLRHL